MREVLLDTNIFIRFITKDIPEQHKKAEKIFIQIENGGKKGFVSILVINEILWVLRTYYGLRRSIYIPKLINLLLLQNIEILEIKKNIIFKILEKMKNKEIDFTDIYLSEIAGSRGVVSFDKDFEKLRN